MLKVHHKFDYAMTFFLLWFVIGLFVDGWSHTHFVEEIESFFNPFHFLLYSGFFASVVCLGFMIYLNMRKEYSLIYAIPAGYGMAAIGMIIFIVGGGLDLIWHSLLGFEESIEALLSPSHLVLFVGGILVVSGPFRAAWERAQSKHTLVELVPMLLSLMFILSIFAFNTQYVHPFTEERASPEFETEDPQTGQALGLAAIILQTIVIVGLILLTVKRFLLPFGSFTVVFTFHIVLLSILHDTQHLIPVFAVAGILVDVLYMYLQPHSESNWKCHVFAFLAPVIIFSLYFANLLFTKGTWWSVHLWMGSIVIAGCVGLLLSYLVYNPRVVMRSRKSAPDV